MERSVLQRVAEIKRFYSLTDSKFAEKISIPQTTISNIMIRNSDIKHSILESILNAFGEISPDWLITGKGEMINTGKAQEDSNSEQFNYRLVPLVNLDVVGGMNTQNLEILGEEYVEAMIPFTNAQEGDCALTVSGDSMSPTCPAGSMVLIRKVMNWKEYFGYGNLFVLLLDDGRRIIKEVQKSEVDSHKYVLCCSHNSKYPAEELPKHMIIGVWKVVKILNERGW